MMNTSKIKIFGSHQKSLISEKQGDEKLMTIYWFLILIIITIGIVSAAVHALGPKDVRDAEAGLLKEKIIDCLIQQGVLNTTVYNSADLLELCRINLNDKTGKYTEIQYAIKIDDKTFGNARWLDNCGIQNVKCEETTVYALSEGKGKYIEIKTAVLKISQNE